MSSDRIKILGTKNDVVLERENIENNLWPVLVRLYKELNFKEVFVLNGPGSFTHLRIGALCVNILNSLAAGTIKVYEISKPDLFQYLYDKWIVKQKKMLMYIWQKKNIWEFDFVSKKYEIVSFESLDKASLNDYVLDDVTKEYRSSNLWIDDLNVVSLDMKENMLIISQKGAEKSFPVEDLSIKPIVEVQPNYFIEANIH